jgi:hypothetical protein
MVNKNFGKLISVETPQIEGIHGLDRGRTRFSKWMKAAEAVKYSVGFG